MTDRDARVERLEAHAYRVPTDQPEADGTLTWDSTTLVVVRLHSEGLVGTGWTYGSAAMLDLIEQTLAREVVGHPAVDTSDTWSRMAISLRNIGRPGLGSMALSAVDNALWDLKARLLDLPLHRLLGSSRDTVPVYGSGGFTTYDETRLDAQLHDWLDHGITAVKIKIGEAWGTREHRDLQRVQQVRDTVGADVAVLVDANGGYAVGQAVRVGLALDELDVHWFEEPVSSDDLAGLRRVRDALRADVAAGEYGDRLDYFQPMLEAQAVDCLQVDVTRCGGVTELLRVAALAAAHHVQISGHCAPYQHAPVLAAVPHLRHLEYFHDHVRIETQLFDGAAPVHDGALRLATGPGHGLTFDETAAAPFAVRKIGVKAGGAGSA